MKVGMNVDQQSRSSLLADCIERMQAGATESDCLAGCGDEAAALVPMLRAAARLQRASAHALSADQREQAMVELRSAMLDQKRHLLQADHAARRPIRLTLAGPLRGLATAATLVLALFGVVTITAVAASRPGDVAYPLRVIVERAPVLLNTTTVGRTMAELRISERRLADLEAHLAASGEIAPAAIGALLAGDQAAAVRAKKLSPVDRAQAAAQVAAHAEALARLAETTPVLAAQETLRTVSTQVEVLAQGLIGTAPDGEGAPAATTQIDAPTPSATPTPLPTPTSSLAEQATGSPTEGPSDATAQPTPAGATPTGHPVGPGQRATALAQTPTATATIEATPSPTRTRVPDTPVPGRRATVLAQTATATHAPESTPAPTHTNAPATPIPGRRATALAETATARPPTATDTTKPTPTCTPTVRPDTPVPGRRATALAQTATPASGGFGSADTGDQVQELFSSRPQAPQPSGRGMAEEAPQGVQEIRRGQPKTITGRGTL